MAFASKDIEFGDVERRNDLYIITENKKDNYSTTKPYEIWGGGSGRKKQLSQQRTLGNHSFSLRERR